MATLAAPRLKGPPRPDGTRDRRATQGRQVSCGPVPRECLSRSCNGNKEARAKLHHFDDGRHVDAASRKGGGRHMTEHATGTREEWLAARLELLEAEKELTRRSDELARQRQQLPWVRIDKDYRFETDEGSASLADLFRGRSQLLIYHFMFGPDYTAGCPACSSIADGFNQSVPHLAHHDVMFWAVSRAPLAKLQAYQRRMGWAFPWASSLGSDFNFDFTVSITEEQQREGAVEYNYQRSALALDVKPEAGGEGNPAKFAAM